MFCYSSQVCEGVFSLLYSYTCFSKHKFVVGNNYAVGFLQLELWFHSCSSVASLFPANLLVRNFIIRCLFRQLAEDGECGIEI